ncbi:MAG: DoxX family protein [Burkholderiaceae bacterium]|nr:DoxX family protein [Burkholderiaceae bacterium]
MPNTFQSATALLGRLLIAAMFLPAGISKLSGFAGTVGYINSVGLPMPAVGATLAILVEILGSAALIAGFGTRAAALVMAFFTLSASYFFHPFWAVPAEQAFMVSLLFYKNIAIIGGLLILAAFGPGAWSIEGRSASKHA